MCTRITVPYKDYATKKCVIGRTMDFANLVGGDYCEFKPGAKASKSFNPETKTLEDATVSIFGRVKEVQFAGKTHYFISDAANNKFSVEGLWLPESTYIDRVTAHPIEKHFDGFSLLQYILSGRFDTLGQIWTALNKYKYVSLPASILIESACTIHFAITEWSTGNVMVVEIGTEGDTGLIKTYGGHGGSDLDNRKAMGFGTMTNSPVYRSHIDNLRGYLNILKPDNVEEGVIGGMPLKMTGNGENLKGIPGSPLPADRFVKATILTDLALRKQGTKDSDGLYYMPNLAAAKKLVAEVLAQVAVVEGTTSEKNNSKWDKTLWTAIKYQGDNGAPVYESRNSTYDGYKVDTPAVIVNDSDE